MHGRCGGLGQHTLALACTHTETQTSKQIVLSFLPLVVVRRQERRVSPLKEGNCQRLDATEAAAFSDFTAKINTNTARTPFLPRESCA